MTIEHLEQLEAWLKTQDVRTASTVITRSALRTLPLAMRFVDNPTSNTGGERYLLACLRASLTSGVTATIPRNDRYASPARSQAFSAADDALYASLDVDASIGNIKARDVALAAADTAKFAADAFDLLSIEEKIPLSPYGTSFETVLQKNMFEDVSVIQNNDIKQCFDTTLWKQEDPPNKILSEWDMFYRNKKDRKRWRFWIRWYEGFLHGAPVDWDLQLQVALIDDAVWEAGPKVVAAAIREIEKNFERRQEETAGQHPEFEPQSVGRLFANAPVVSANAQALALQVSTAIEVFLHDTGSNQLPECFQMLDALPNTLTEIGRKLQTYERSTESEQALKEEIGRLNAKIAKLEDDLAEALKKQPSVFGTAFKEQAGKSIADWKLYAAIAGAVWMLSGDELGMQKRCENLLGQASRLCRTDSTSETLSLPAQEPIPTNSKTTTL